MRATNLNYFNMKHFERTIPLNLISSNISLYLVLSQCGHMIPILKKKNTGNKMVIVISYHFHNAYLHLKRWQNELYGLHVQDISPRSVLRPIHAAEKVIRSLIISLKNIFYKHTSQLLE